MNRLTTVLTTAALTVATLPSWSGEADVIDARAERAPDGSYRIMATLKHADEGWEHYANRWEVLGPDEEILGTRVLYHPHVDEQPFTRTLSDVRVPAGVTEVTIRAHDSVHGYGGKTFRLDLNR